MKLNFDVGVDQYLSADMMTKIKHEIQNRIIENGEHCIFLRFDNVIPAYWGQRTTKKKPSYMEDLIVKVYECDNQYLVDDVGLNNIDYIKSLN